MIGLLDHIARQLYAAQEEVHKTLHQLIRRIGVTPPTAEENAAAILAALKPYFEYVDQRFDNIQQEIITMGCGRKFPHSSRVL